MISLTDEEIVKYTDYALKEYYKDLRVSNFNSLLESFSNFKEREAMIAALLDAGISPKQLLKKQVTLYENMFADMDTLVGDITLADGLKKIPSMCFSNTNIETITLSKTVETIDANAFIGCSQLKEVIIPQDSELKTIGGNAFANCKNLTKFWGPDSLEVIGLNAFFPGDNLQELNVPQSCRIKISGPYGEFLKKIVRKR